MADEKSNRKTSERIDGETPAGGSYSIAFFSDADGKATTKDKAEAVEIHEFNDKDEVIQRTYMGKKGKDGAADLPVP